MVQTLKRDATQAWCGLFRQQTTTLAIIATIALAVGAGTSVLAVMARTMVRPLPYPEPHRLVALYTLPPGITRAADRNPLHSLEFVRFRQELRLADAVEGAWPRDRSLSGGGDPASVPAAQVSSGFLPMLGAQLAAGRFWTADEDRAGLRVAVLSHGLWLREFGGREAVGHTITLDRESFEVVGVIETGFRSPMFAEAELWTPLGIHEGNLPLPRATYIQTVVRLSPEATSRQLAAEVSARMVALATEHPSTHTGWTAGVVSLREREFGDNRVAFALLAGAVLVLVLIAGANLASLLLSHVSGQRHEIALRVALGASHWDLIRLHIVEFGLIAAAGGLIGIAVAAFVLPLLLSLDPSGAKVLGRDLIDAPVLASAAALAAGIVLAAGIPAVRRELRADLASRLAETGTRLTSSRRDQRLRRHLVAAEAALAVVLLVVGAVLISSLIRMSRQDLGFDPSGVVAGQLRLPEVAYPTQDARTAFVSAVIERVRALPGVMDAGTTMSSLRPGSSYVTLIGIEGRPTPDGSLHTVQFRRVTPSLFRTLGIHERTGRTFDEHDRADSQPVAVASEAFARRFWPGEDAVGKRILRGSTTIVVCGVVGDVHDLGAGVAPDAMIYLPYAQTNTAAGVVTLVVHVSGDALASVPAIRAAILAVDPAQPLGDVMTLESFLAETLGPERFRSILLLVFGVVGLLLALVGVYGVTSRLVEDRRREIGIRRVFGASGGDVWGSVVVQAVTTVAYGVLIGGAGAALGAVLLRHLVPAVVWADAWAAVPAIGVLAIAAVVAAGIPAFRAVKVDPAAALRSGGGGIGA